MPPARYCAPKAAMSCSPFWRLPRMPKSGLLTLTGARPKPWAGAWPPASTVVTAFITPVSSVNGQRNTGSDFVGQVLQPEVTSAVNDIAYGDATRGQKALGLLNGETAIMEDRRRKHGVGAADLQAIV